MIDCSLRRNINNLGWLLVYVAQSNEEDSSLLQDERIDCGDYRLLLQVASRCPIPSQPIATWLDR